MHVSTARGVSSAATPLSAPDCRWRPASLADQRLRPGAVTACFFGEGAVTEGVSRKPEPGCALAAAAAVRLREQRLRDGRAAGDRRIPARGSSGKRRRLPIEAEAVDGMEFRSRSRSRPGVRSSGCAGQGPFCLNVAPTDSARTDVRRPGLPQPRREAWREHDPIARMRAWLQSSHQMSEVEAAAIEAAVEADRRGAGSGPRPVIQSRSPSSSASC